MTCSDSIGCYVLCLTILIHFIVLFLVFSLPFILHFLINMTLIVGEADESYIYIGMILLL
jgi:hypothetical protein